MRDADRYGPHAATPRGLEVSLMLVSEQARVFQVRGLRCSEEPTSSWVKPGSVRKPNLPGLEDH